MQLLLLLLVLSDIYCSSKAKKKEKKEKKSLSTFNQTARTQNQSKGFLAVRSPMPARYKGEQGRAHGVE